MQLPMQLALSRLLLFVAALSCCAFSPLCAASASDSAAAAAAAGSVTKLPRTNKVASSALVRREQRRSEEAREDKHEALIPPWEEAYDESNLDGARAEISVQSETGAEAAVDAAQAAPVRSMPAHSPSPPFAASGDHELVKRGTSAKNARARHPHVQVHAHPPVAAAVAAAAQSEPRRSSALKNRKSSELAPLHAQSPVLNRLADSGEEDVMLSSTQRQSRQSRHNDRQTLPLQESVIRRRRSNSTSALDIRRRRWTRRRRTVDDEVDAKMADELVEDAKQQQQQQLADGADASNGTEKGASCSTHACPKGFHPKQDSESLYCLGSKCATYDTRVCCDVEKIKIEDLDVSQYKLGEPAGMCDKATRITNQTECFLAVSRLIPAASVDWEKYHSSANSFTNPTYPDNCCVKMDQTSALFRPIWNGESSLKNGDESFIPVCRVAVIGADGITGGTGQQGAAGGTGVAGARGAPGEVGEEGPKAPPPVGLVPPSFLAGVIALNLLCGVVVWFVGQQELTEKKDVLGKLACLPKIPSPKSSAEAEGDWAEDDWADDGTGG